MILLTVKWANEHDKKHPDIVEDKNVKLKELRLTKRTDGLGVNVDSLTTERVFHDIGAVEEYTTALTESCIRHGAQVPTFTRRVIGTTH